MDRSDIEHDDAAQLRSLGYSPDLSRRMSFFSMLGMAFTVLNSWSVLSVALPLSLKSGGPAVIIWGLLMAGLGNLCLASSLGEFLSAYPTAGGQYHWAAVVAPQGYEKVTAWTTGWLSVFGWISVAASGSLLTSQLALGLFFGSCEDCSISRTTQFVTYSVVTAAAFVVNMFLHGAIPVLNRAAFTWSLVGFTIIPITTLAYGPTLSDPRFVFGHFINRTGWSDAMAWMFGLLQAGLGLNGFDAVAHMVEEIPDPSNQGPVIMISCVVLGVITGFLFLASLMFVSGGEDTIDQIIDSNGNPLVQILLAATNSPVACACLAVFPLISLFLGTTSIITASSRMTFAFARDGGLPWSTSLATVHKASAMPLNALCFSTAVAALFGCIFVISDTAFNAIAAASVTALGLSYALPVVLHCLQGRRISHSAPFQMWPPLGWAVNLLGVTYALITSVLFLFPPTIPVDISNMNYGGVVLLLIMLFSSAMWLINGRYRYKGPALLGYQALSVEEPIEPDQQ